MKLTAILLTILCIHASAKSYEQTVSFSGKNVTLKKVFESIEKQTGMSFFFNYSILKESHSIDLDVHDVPVTTLLSDILKLQGLAFYISGRTIFVIKSLNPGKKEEKIDSSQFNVNGKVTGLQGQPLVGASIVVKKNGKGTVTDERGVFALKNVPNDAILEISFAGYQKKDVFVSGNRVVNVELNLANNQLDETQVIAYGQTSERMSVGDVTTIKASDIGKQPIGNPMEALEGRVPGLYVSQTNGISGGAVKVQIRGQNNIHATAYVGNDPLYVIDGVPYVSQLLPGLNTILGSSNSNGAIVGSPMSFINPDDIESMSVLKDADATAIYGSRAANGAILITTKKGKPGITSVNLNFQDGEGMIGRKLDLMNTQQYLQMRNEALNNDGLSPGPYDFDLNGTWDTTRYSDWQKIFLGNKAEYLNLNGSVSGGNSNTQYLIGTTYHRETTVFSNNFSDQKVDLHFSIKSASNNQKFQIQLTGSYLVDNNQLPQSDLTSYAVTLAPDAPKLYTSNQSINWAPSAGSTTFSNPIAALYQRYINKTNNLISNGSLSYSVLPGLNILTNFGYTNLQSNEMFIFPQISYQPEIQATGAARSANFGNNNINSWILEPQANYKRRYGFFSIELLAGLTFNQNNSNGLEFQGTGQTSDQVLNDIRSATKISVTSTTATVYKYNAFFGRGIFGFNDKYLLNLSIRRDGSSRFGSANQFHGFGSVGVGWVFSNENFIQNLTKVLSFGKIRATYGTTGSDQIGDYQYMNLYTAKNYAVPYQGISSLSPTGLPNPYLEWQETKKGEVGTDLGFDKDKFLISASYFRNQSSNQLIGFQLPIITGFSTILKNLPATVENKGLELVLTATIIKSKNLSWITAINFSSSENKLTAYPITTNHYYKVGYPISYTQTYHYMGVDPATGLYQFSDGKGGVTSQPDTNSLVTETGIVKSNPTFFGGFNNAYRFKNFELGIFFQFVRENGPSFFYGTFMPGLVNTNEPTWVLNRWKGDGEVSLQQKYSSGYNYANTWSDVLQSNATYRDASFIRLKNISFSWELPRMLRDKAKMQDAKIFIQAQNVLTITGYRGLDPETLSSSSLPPLRVITFGINATL